MDLQNEALWATSVFIWQGSLTTTFSSIQLLTHGVHHVCNFKVNFCLALVKGQISCDSENPSIIYI
jgi:hypothetical protein